MDNRRYADILESLQARTAAYNAERGSLVRIRADLQTSLTTLHEEAERISKLLNEGINDPKVYVMEVSVTNNGDEANQLQAVNVRIADKTLTFAIDETPGDGPVLRASAASGAGQEDLIVRAYRGEATVQFSKLARIIPTGTTDGTYNTLFFVTGPTTLIQIQFATLLEQILADAGDALRAAQQKSALRAYGQAVPRGMN